MVDRDAALPLGRDALDFWLGTWMCSWDGGHGLNRITKELEDCAIVERFESLAPERWSGMSVSAYDPLQGWRQTWVDSNDNYWAFEGDPHPEGVAFTAEDLEDGRTVLKRMVFFDRQRDAFRWRWERSTDGGARREPLWTIEYRRADQEP